MLIIWWCNKKVRLYFLNTKRLSYYGIYWRFVSKSKIPRIWCVGNVNQPFSDSLLTDATESTRLFAEFAARDCYSPFDLFGFSRFLLIGNSGYCFDLHEISLVFGQFIWALFHVFFSILVLSRLIITVPICESPTPTKTNWGLVEV